MKFQVRVFLWVFLGLGVMLLVYGFSWRDFNASYAGRIVEVIIPAPALKGNLLGDPIDQRVIVYLPPSYRTEISKRYPVLYLLHAFTASIEKTWLEGTDIRTNMDLALAQALAREMILVMPNASNAYRGSFYVNSETTGNWEDFISEDLVGYVDRHFRTLPQPSSRGIAGHSMGGFGAIRVGMKHSDIFSAIYAVSPCCLAMMGDIGVDSPGWRQTIKLQSRDGLKQIVQQGNLESFYVAAHIALAAAFSPNPDRPPFFADFPWREKNGQLVPHEPAFTKWQSHFPVNMVEQYQKNLIKLRGLQIEYGVNDQFPHILITIPIFSQKLAVHRVPHVLRVHKGDHANQLGANMKKIVFPFFSQTLEFEVRR
jgi:S-formylglutathione hydrolase